MRKAEARPPTLSRERGADAGFGNVRALRPRSDARLPARGSARTAAIKPLRGFPAVIRIDTETLILGSFPSAASLTAKQYYAHPRNQFWRLLGALLAEPLERLDYASRLARVLAHRVGIWDVLGACRRNGSLDTAIRSARANDFSALEKRAPRLARVFFNGQTAGRFAPAFRDAGFVVAVLPSSSPAHAGRTFRQKLGLWRRAFESKIPRSGTNA